MTVVRGIQRRGDQLTKRTQIMGGLPLGAPPVQAPAMPVGVVTLSGNIAATRWRSTPSIGVVTLSGIVPKGRWLTKPTPVQNVNLSGQAATTTGIGKVFPSIGVISLTGQSFGGIPVYMPVGFKSIALSGQTIAKIKLGAQPLTGILLLSGLAPSVRVVAKPPIKQVTLSGIAPLFKNGAVCLPGILYLFGQPPRSASDWEAEDSLDSTLIPEVCVPASLVLEVCVPVTAGVETNPSLVPSAEAPVTMSFVPKDPVR